MNQKQIGWRMASVAVCLFGCISTLRADDSAASIAAGGLVPRHETRIVMAKEVLKISLGKIVVDYDFRNDSNEDVTTEVAFPIPAYTNEVDGPGLSLESFSDFKLTIDGKDTPFLVEAKAFLDGDDVSETLRADNIDIPTFGHFDEDKLVSRDFEQLSSAEQKRLVELGLYAHDPPTENWNAHVQYHWTQTFPAHSTVHIRHEYTPVEGSELMPKETVAQALQATRTTNSAAVKLSSDTDARLLQSFCPDRIFLQTLQRSMVLAGTDRGYFALPHWIDFILTSANTWKQPIEDFTLIVERGKSEPDDKGRLISFCSPKNAAVQKVDADHFQVHLTNFVPESELHIGFFDLPKPGVKK